MRSGARGLLCRSYLDVTDFVLSKVSRQGYPLHRR